MTEPISETDFRRHGRDRAWRLNHLYSVTDKTGRRMPFRMNWAQRRFFAERKPLNLILKARQLGFTTFIQLLMLDEAMFSDNVRCGVIAHTRGDAEAIFRDKVRFAYDTLPEFIRARNLLVRDNSASLEFENGSSIVVGTSLRGGTLQMLHVSEFGKICARFPDKAREIVTGALNTLDVGQQAFIESTAEGREGAFYDLCEAAQARERRGQPVGALDWAFHFYPWWREPGYRLSPEGVIVPPSVAAKLAAVEGETGSLSDDQKAWYARKAEVQGADMTREFPSTPAEAFEASVEGAYYGNQIALAEANGRIGRVPHEPQILVETWWDLGMDDATAIWFVQRANREIRLIDYYEASGEGLAHYAQVLQARGYVYGRHVCPHDIEVRELGSGVSRADTARRLGVKPLVTAPRMPLADGIEAMRNLLARCWFDEVKCADGIKALKGYRKEWDAERGVWAGRPRHDRSSHAADAFRTGAVMGDPAVKRPPVDRPVRHWMS